MRYIFNRWILSLALCLFFLELVVLHSEGIRGIRLFLNFEASVLVIFLPLFVTLGVFRPRDVWQAFKDGILGQGDQGDARILSFYRRITWAAGVLASVLGLVLMLRVADDVSRIPRHMAFALVPILFSFFIAEFVIAPLEMRLSGEYEETKGTSLGYYLKLTGFLFLAIFVWLFAFLIFMAALLPRLF